MKKILGISIVAGAILFTGCGPKSININEYPKRVNTPVVIPDVCKSQYDALKSIPKVAVLPFTNNSSFGVASVDEANVNARTNKVAMAVSSKVSAAVREKARLSASRRASVGVSAGVGVAGGGAVVGAGVSAGASASESASVEREAGVSRTDTAAVAASTSNTNVSANRTQRVVDPKLDKAITSALEGMLAEMGGAEVYSRSDLKKVINEQKLQQSGLIDEKTAVKIGKLAGVRYIITGSIDGVTIEHKDYREAGRSFAKGANQNKKGSPLIGAAAQLLAANASGWKITTTGTIKVIDAQTGKIVYSKRFEETKNIGMVDKPQLTYEDKIGGIKADIEKAVESAREGLSQYFAPKGYIIQVRTNKKDYIALINLGSKDKIKPGQQFKVLSFEKVVDPINHTASCSMNTLAVTLTVAKNQIQTDKSWTYAEGEDAPNLRPGQMIIRKALKSSLSF